MDVKVLKDVGLTDGECKVYFALLRQGKSAAGALVSESGISRSKVYEILERLQAKGLVSEVVENGVQRYRPLDPRLIPDLLKKKIDSIELTRKSIDSMIPALLAQMQGAEDQSVEVFTGWSAVRNIFSVLIKDAKKGDVWCAFGLPEVYSEERARFFAHWRKETDAIGIRQRLIANRRIKGSPELAEKSKFSSIRYTSYETPTTVDIFKEHTLVSIWIRKPVVILVKSKEVAQSFTSFFEQLWSAASK